LRLRFAEGHILTEFRVSVGHGLVTVPDPEAQQIFRRSLFPKMRDAEAPEAMEPGFLPPHAAENQMQTAPQYIRLRERAAARRAEDEAVPPPANEVFEHGSHWPSQVHFPDPIPSLGGL